MAAPSTWPSAICGLITWPQSTASTSFNTVTRPVSTSTSTSAKTAANGGGESYDMCEAPAMIWNWSCWYSDDRHTCSYVTERPSWVQTLPPWATRSFGSSFSRRPPTSTIWPSTARAAFSTARPEMYVVDEAYAPGSNGVMSVSDEYGMIFSIGTPSVSAAIWQNIVSLPVPMSVAPMVRLKLASSFILSAAAPMSTPGMPEACITIAMPRPRRLGPWPTTSCLRFLLQPIALAPCSIAFGSPHERISCG